MKREVPPFRFDAKLHRPGGADHGAPWTFFSVPREQSDLLSTRGIVSVEGTLNRVSFQAALQPDGEGGHWMKVDQNLRELAGAAAGDIVTLEMVPCAIEPEPAVPDDLQSALAESPKARATWTCITPLARRDWIHWITSGKRAETRVQRTKVAISQLSAGKRRPCCFDRSGVYSKSLQCPVAADDAKQG